jgi:hypothetical protein
MVAVGPRDPEKPPYGDTANEACGGFDCKMRKAGDGTRVLTKQPKPDNDLAPVFIRRDIWIQLDDRGQGCLTGCIYNTSENRDHQGSAPAREGKMA